MSTEYSMQIKISLFIIVIVCIIFLFCFHYSYRHENMNNSDAEFIITFRTNWGKPGTGKILGYPVPPEEAPHTGNMFLAIHNHSYYPFKLGENASTGVANSAMYGTNDDLINEIKSQKNDYYKYYIAPVLQTPGMYQFNNVTANADYPYMSFVTMVAPSPDWFTGISSINLLNIQTSASIPIYAYDAGTDSGTKFITLPKHPLNDASKPISYLASGEMFPKGIAVKDIPPFAFIDIMRLS